MAYSPPPLRREDFRDQYIAKRRANQGTVTKVESPYGETLAYRDWKGDPISRNGDGGGNILDVAMTQLGQDNAPPYSAPIPVVSPYGDVGYTRRPFQAGNGQTNWVPGGTVSSVIPPPVQFSDPAGVVQTEGVGEIGEPIAEQATPVQQIQDTNYQLSRAFQNPNDPYRNSPEYQNWVNSENERRLGNSLGPMENAFNDFVRDKDEAEQQEQTGKDLYNSLRRQDRLTRESQGRRGRDGRMVATRSSGISPGYAKQLQSGARDVARRIQSGETGDAITQAWDNLTRGASAGAPIPMPYKDVAGWRNLENDAQRTETYQIDADRRSAEYAQRQEDRALLQEGLTRFANAKDDAERQDIIRKYPQILGNSAGRALDRQQDPADVSESEYGKALIENRFLGKIPTRRLTQDQKNNLAHNQQVISLYDQKRTDQLGLTQAPPASAPAPTLPEGKVINQGGKRYRVTNGVPIEI